MTCHVTQEIVVWYDTQTPLKPPFLVFTVLHNGDARCPFTAVMSSLQGYVDRRVLLVLQDGRAIVVRFLALDIQHPNLSDSRAS